MKPKQSSIYRQLELLDVWCAKTCDTLPKNAYLQEKGRLLAKYTSEALSCCYLALDVADLKSRLDLINTVIFNVVNIKSIIKTFCEYSSQNPASVRIVSLKQRQLLLDKMARMNAQIHRWQTATLNSVKGTMGA